MSTLIKFVISQFSNDIKHIWRSLYLIFVFAAYLIPSIVSIIANLHLVFSLLSDSPNSSTVFGIELMAVVTR